jgi:hypothetical protein
MMVDFTLFAQTNKIYRHPHLSIEFEAPGNWHPVVRSEDSLIYEMINEDSLVHVVIWYTETEQRAPDYLWKMASMKELKLDKKPVEIQTENYSGWMLQVKGFDNNMQIYTFLVVIPGGKSQSRPRENKLYIVQIWCPNKYYDDKSEVMNHILNSIKVEETE